MLVCDDLIPDTTPERRKALLAWWEKTLASLPEGAHVGLLRGSFYTGPLLGVTDSPAESKS